MSNQIDKSCLCGSELLYSNCCQLFHTGEKSPATAITLMKSRFTAYAMHNTAYLSQTWVESKRPKSINFSQDEARWTRLEIIKTKKGNEKDSKGIVEFKAYYLLDDEECVMNEISRFQKSSGQWLYLDGVVKSVGKVNLSQNQGKNALCPCGSKKKFKRCCGK